MFIKNLASLILVFCVFISLYRFVNAQDVTSTYLHISSADLYTASWIYNFDNIFSEDNIFMTCTSSTTLLANCMFRPFFAWNNIPDNAVIKALDIKIKGYHPGTNSINGGALHADLSSQCSPPHTSLGSSTIISYIPLTVNSWHELHVSLTGNLTGKNIKDSHYCINLWLENVNNNRIWYVDDVQARITYTIPNNTPSDTPSPTPTPSGPLPFLDLPWDYTSKGLGFSESALRMSALFDHEYPLLSFSTLNTSQPNEAKDSLMSYNSSERTSKPYSSHDGYDYAANARVRLGDEVRAAAAGTATLVTGCVPCGNAIFIDHHNGFQTRYYHLQSDGLIMPFVNIPIEVVQDQPIGRVGFSGNTYPQGELGAHLHFMVVEDKDKDGNFNNNIPDGILDPYGWQPPASDPWETYQFTINNQQKTGNKSYYLWKNKLESAEETIDTTGGNVIVGKYTMNFPPNFTTQTLIIKLNSNPWEKLSDTLQSLGSTVRITAETLAHQFVTQFTNTFHLTVDFSGEDLNGIDPNSLSLYASEDGKTWTKVDTFIDMEEKKASADLDHLTYFGLFAERSDIEAPVTSVTFTGDQGEVNWFRSKVQIALDAQDGEGTGIAYTAYRIDGGDWQEYTNELTFEEEGDYTVEFYSTDEVDNIETPKSMTFHIDKTIPEVHIFFSIPDKDFKIEGRDNGETPTLTTQNLDNKQIQYIFTDRAGNSAKLDLKSWVNDPPGQLQFGSITYNDGNPFDLSMHNMHVLLKTDKANALKEFLEIWNMNDLLNIKLKFDPKTTITKVTALVNGVETIIANLTGLHAFSFQTNQGELQYSY